MAPVLLAAQARWDAVGQPAVDDIRQSIADVEAALERAESVRLLRQLDAVLEPRGVDVGTPSLDRPPPSREGLGL